MSLTFVVVGAGHAGGQLVASLRTEGFDGRVVLIGEEPHIPYQRPPLSKQYLAGEMALDRVLLKNREFYDKAGVELHLESRADAIDRQARQVVLANGARIGYDKLALTTGARVRELDAPGVDLPGVFYLRGLRDVERIRTCFEPESHGRVPTTAA